MNKDLMFSSKTDLWATPQDFYDKLDEEFHFTLDPCATAENAKCKKFFTKDDDGLIQDWGGVLRVLQSSLWQRVKKVGRKVQSRVKEAKYDRSNAYSC